MTNTPKPIQYLAEDALIDLRHQGTGQVRRGYLTLLIVLPLLTGTLAFVFWRDALEPAKWFPAAAIFAGALMGTVSLLFGRVKDAVAAPRLEVGRDPVYQATVVFRSALYCAEVALAINAVLLAITVMPAGKITQVGGCVALALFAHLGIKVTFLLVGLRAQMFAAAGSRAQRPLALVRHAS